MDDKPAEYRVMEPGDDVLLRDDQVLTLHRVLMRGRLQTYLRALRGSLWWHIFDLRDVLACGSLSADLDAQLSDQPARDQRGIVFFALRAAFASAAACTAAIGRAAIVVPLEAAAARPDCAAFNGGKTLCCSARTAGTGAAMTSSRCVARVAAAAASCSRRARPPSGRARAT